MIATPLETCMAELSQVFEAIYTVKLDKVSPSSRVWMWLQITHRKKFSQRVDSSMGRGLVSLVIAT